MTAPCGDSKQNVALGVARVRFSASCASVELVPARAPSRGRALAVGPEVEVRAQTGGIVLWAVPNAFTPVRIRSAQAGAEPVYVGLADIQLAGATVALSAVPAASIPSPARGQPGHGPGLAIRRSAEHRAGRSGLR